MDSTALKYYIVMDVEFEAKSNVTTNLKEAETFAIMETRKCIFDNPMDGYTEMGTLFVCEIVSHVDGQSYEVRRIAHGGDIFVRN